jgi:hypothetical protein
VPGGHDGANMRKFGHLKLQDLASAAMQRSLSRDGGAAASALGSGGGVGSAGESDVVIAQCSSIGSLGPADRWWETNLRRSLCAIGDGVGGTGVDSKCPIKLVWPSVEAVRTSTEGYANGLSIPFSEKNYARQGWITNYAHHWRAEWCGRTRWSPHIKTYCRYSASDRALRWVVLTSHNVSKAAWGEVQNVGRHNEKL